MQNQSLYQGDLLVYISCLYVELCSHNISHAKTILQSSSHFLVYQAYFMKLDTLFCILLGPENSSASLCHSSIVLLFYSLSPFSLFSNILFMPFYVGFPPTCFLLALQDNLCSRAPILGLLELLDVVFQFPLLALPYS